MSERNCETEDEARFHEATARRLARLRTMPVDTRRLESLLRDKLPAEPRAEAQRSYFFGNRFSLRPLRTVAAAAVLVAVLAAALLLSSGREALASTSQMAQMHRDLVEGRIASVQVDSVEAANKVLMSQSTQAPEVPDLPEGHVMACCMKSVKDKKVACLLLKSEGVPVTMAVARAEDVKRQAKGRKVERNGLTFEVESVGALNMVMTERQGRFVCIMGEVPAEQLMSLASKLEF